jgi:hypothetical protein
MVYVIDDDDDDDDDDDAPYSHSWSSTEPFTPYLNYYFSFYA